MVIDRKWVSYIMSQTPLDPTFVSWSYKFTTLELAGHRSSLTKMTITRPRVATLGESASNLLTGESLIIDTFTRFQDGVEVPVNKPDQVSGP